MTNQREFITGSEVIVIETDQQATVIKTERETDRYFVVSSGGYSAWHHIDELKPNTKGPARFDSSQADFRLRQMIGEANRLVFAAPFTLYVHREFWQLVCREYFRHFTHYSGDILPSVFGNVIVGELVLKSQHTIPYNRWHAPYMVTDSTEVAVLSEAHNDLGKYRQLSLTAEWEITEESTRVDKIS